MTPKLKTEAAFGWLMAFGFGTDLPIEAEGVSPDSPLSYLDSGVNLMQNVCPQYVLLPLVGTQYVSRRFGETPTSSVNNYSSRSLSIPYHIF